MLTATSIFMLMALSGCVTPEQQAAMLAQNDAQDDAFCRSISARPGSNAYVNCRLVQQQQRQQGEYDAETRRRAFASQLGQTLNPPSRPPQFCNTNPNGIGGYVTSCM